MRNESSQKVEHERERERERDLEVPMLTWI